MARRVDVAVPTLQLAVVVHTVRAGTDKETIDGTANEFNHIRGLKFQFGSFLNVEAVTGFTNLVTTRSRRPHQRTSDVELHL